MRLSNLVLLGLVIMLQQHITSAVPRAKTYLVDTAALEDDTEPEDLGHVGLVQGNDYGLEETESIVEQITKQSKRCKKRRKQVRRCKTKCKRMKRFLGKCRMKLGALGEKLAKEINEKIPW